MDNHLYEILVETSWIEVSKDEYEGEDSLPKRKILVIEEHGEKN